MTVANLHLSKRHNTEELGNPKKDTRFQDDTDDTLPSHQVESSSLVCADFCLNNSFSSTRDSSKGFLLRHNLPSYVTVS